MKKNKKILIIEDDANLLCGMQAKFSVQGFEVQTYDGFREVELLHRIKTFKPDYIILDIILPNLDSFKILSKIKADAQISEIPIFIFSDLSDAESRRKSQELGADFYLIKSELNLDEFVEKFKKIIENREKNK